MRDYIKNLKNTSFPQGKIWLTGSSMIITHRSFLEVLSMPKHP